MPPDTPLVVGEETAVLAFLADPVSYPGRPDRVDSIETHMSRVFLAGDRVYKLKKPVRFSFVDFTTLEARRRNCERELALNQRLAPDVYLAVQPLVRGPRGRLAFGGDGEIVEWLVVMRRLEPTRLLDQALVAGTVTPADVDALCDRLAKFYAQAARLPWSPEQWVTHWHRLVALSEDSLTDPVFGLAEAPVVALLGGLWRFLEEEAALLHERVAAGRIVDGHGDLRPEHVHLGPPLRVIDRLEFDERLRWSDPFDEASFLAVECERLGNGWVGPRLIDGLADRLGERPPRRLLGFYRGYRAALRARLSIEHLRDPAPREPARWPRQARTYLDIGLAAIADQS